MSIDNALEIIRSKSIPVTEYIKVESKPTTTVDNRRIVQNKPKTSRAVTVTKTVIANTNQYVYVPIPKKEYKVVGNSAASVRNSIAVEGIKTRKLRAEQFLFSISQATTVGDIARACRRIDDHEAAEHVLKLEDSEAKTLAATMVREVEKEVQEYTRHLASMGM